MRKYVKYIVIFFILVLFIKNPYDINSEFLQRSSLSNLMGTDDLGRDIYTRLLLGTFNTVLISAISIGLCTIIGNIIGFLSGYFGGIIDYVFQMLVEIILSIPSILIAVTVVVIIQKPQISLIISMIIMYLPLVINYARGLVIKEKDKNYVIAAKTYGVKNIRIIVKHIFPNVKKYVLTNLGINFSKGILTEAGLGFLGIGLDPSIPTLGNMLNASRSYFIKAPWFTLFPGIIIIVIVYYANKFSKGKGSIKNGKRIRN
ncbi:ABC transporter permease [Oceanivirga salmonicida]|uniref:ABC transporter permease n=1 Tax=Oceanivirga salmonicida TaxID=1769291 RepID=UPI000829F52F|nr:ABC transporter permease [Oceanivirga salmonicida]